MNGYELSRRWFDFSFDNKEAKVQHTAIYMWCIELNNRLGWKKEFGLPTIDTMEGLSIGNKNTFLSALDDLVTWGFILIVKEPKNQSQCRIVSICYIESDTALVSALDTAVIQQSTRQSDGTGVGTDPIDKPRNQETIKPQTKKPKTLPEAKPPRPRNHFHDVFDKWFLSIAGVPYEMDKKDWVGIEQIKKYCEKNSKNGNPLESFALVLSKYDNLPRFYQENRNPAFIASKFSEIISLLKRPVKSQGQDNIVDLYNKTHAELGQQEGNIDFTKHLEK